MRIAFFEVKDWEEEYLKKKLDGHQLKFSIEKLSLANARKQKILMPFQFSSTLK
jgi:hypothetical protein